MEKRITAIKRQKRNSQRVNIYLDGEYAFPLYSTKAVPLHVGQCLTDQEIHQLEDNDTKQKAYSNAMRLISRRPRSIKEVQDSLQKKDLPDNVIESTLDRLIQAGLLDDLEFTRYWIDQRVTFKPRGSVLLRQELLFKGVEDAVIKRELDTIDEEELARKAAQKWTERPSNLAKEDYQSKLSAFLARRGFKYSVVRTVVGRLQDEIDGNLKREY